MRWSLWAEKVNFFSWGRDTLFRNQRQDEDHDNDHDDDHDDDKWDHSMMFQWKLWRHGWWYCIVWWYKDTLFRHQRQDEDHEGRRTVGDKVKLFMKPVLNPLFFGWQTFCQEDRWSDKHIVRVPPFAFKRRN